MEDNFENVGLEEVKKAIDFAIFAKIVSTRRDLAKKMDYSLSMVSLILNGKTPLSPKFVRTLAGLHPSIEKVLLGEQEVESPPFLIDTEDDYKKVQSMGLKVLPEVNFEFAGGFAELINQTEYTKRFWYLPDCTDCDGVAVISGNSMAPAYPSGCQVALKKIGFNPKDPLNIPFGHVFGVVIEDDITGMYHGHIKILRKHTDKSKEMTHWIARSIDRENYDDFYIPINMVRGLWIVKQHIVQDIIL